MTERIVMINNKIYSLKFGMKSLIVLAENSNLSEPEMRRLQFFLAIQNNQVSYEESLELLKELEKNIDVDSLLSQVLDISLGANSSGSAIRLSPTLSEQIEELYQKAVGELGIAPQIFYTMTPHEVALAYQGYLDKKFLEANLQIVAGRKVGDSKATMISLHGDGVQLSTIAKRNETFDALGI